MKLGAENSKKTIIAVGLLIVAAIMTIRMFMGSGTPSQAAPANMNAVIPTAPGGVRVPPRRARITAKSGGPLTPTLDPRLPLNALKDTETSEYSGKGRNIFLAQENDVVIPKPVASAIKQPTPPPAPVVYTPPPPPPIDLKFFGFASSEGVKKVLLSRGDDVFVATEGDIVNRRYKIMKINPTSVEVMDVLSNNRQTIPLTAG